MNLDSLFDIADALCLMKIEEDRIFLKRQRERVRPGCIEGVDKKLPGRQERARQKY